MPQLTKQPASSKTGQFMALVRRLGLENISLVLAITVLALAIGSQNSAFFRPSNIAAIGSYIVIMGLLAVVETVVIIMGGIDISVGSVAGLASVLTGMVYAAAWGNWWLSMLVPLLAGVACGLFNGIVVVFGRITPLIATLATLSGFKGLAQLVSNGRAQGYTGADPVYIFLARGKILFIPTLVWVLIIVAAAIHIMLRYTRLGRDIYAVGGNDTAARLSGVNINRRILFVFVLAGVVSAIAGILITARTGSGQPVSGSQGMEMLAVTGGALGGAALRGGKGSVISTIFAVILLGVLLNGMTLLGVNPFWQNVAQGALLIAAVVIQQLSSGERRVGLPK
ncbi:MAG: ABC transporter permease [Bifidobacteriaceae bacterium]|jgi:ribose transport system permease protein|nr:ABC transporter permease [Bifidobacteriaceae bacterium]